MDVRIRPAGYLFLAAIVVFLIYRLLYTLLWEHSRVPVPVPTTTPSSAIPMSAAPIGDWLVLAPISTSASDSIVDTAYLPDEAHLQPKEGATAPIQGKTLTWVKSHTYPLDLAAAAPGGKEKNTAAYAVATVNMPKAYSDASLLLISDSAMKVWLNNKPILTKPVGGEKGADSQVPHLSLNAGPNTFVFKVGPSAGEWKLTAALQLP